MFGSKPWEYGISCEAALFVEKTYIKSVFQADTLRSKDPDQKNNTITTMIGSCWHIPLSPSIIPFHLSSIGYWICPSYNTKTDTDGYYGKST